MLSKEFFKNNRNKLFSVIEDNSIVVLFSGSAPKKSYDEQYPFAVNKNFYYETGINEANDIVILSKINGECSSTLFIARFDEKKAKWVGKTLNEEEAKEISDVENVRYIDEFEEVLDEYLVKVDYVYLDMEKQSFEERLTNAELFKAEINEVCEDVTVLDCFNLIAEHRMIKEKEEIELIKKAIDITRVGIETIMKNSKSEVYEYQLEAYFDFEIKRNGATDFAFKTIAASGVNGAVLHYSENNSLIEKGSLILFDLGAEYKLYNADISRTFPVDGKFSDRQKQIYEIVLRGQDLVISNVKPGITLIELNNILVNFYADELIKIGLISEKEEVKKYYYHGVSHHLGLDTHDASIRNYPLKEGAVITVEPGLYIEEEKIGIRIENDVLVTSDGCIDLASDIIRTVEDIEDFMKK